MAILKFIILTLILTGAQSALADDPIAPIVTNTTTVAPLVTNATTTVAPVVTNATTTTVAPVETTTKPTEKPTTKPTPAPGPIITTTPTPVIPWPANEYTWIVEQDNVTCIKLMGAFELILPYKIDKAGNDTTLKNAILPIPKTTKATGQCGIDTQTITLNWNCSNTQQISNQLTFHFGVSRNKTTPYPDVTVGKWGLINITGEVHIDSNCFPNATETNSTIIIDIIDHLVTYQSSINHSYKCIAKESLKDKSGQELKLSDLQVEAFRSGSGDNFGAAQECALDGVTDVVPIAVGASLAGLVVIVLIAYLFGRRRSRARGYQSV